MPNDTPQVSGTAARLDTHEAVCAERYQGIQTRLKDGDKRMARIERALYVLLLMAAAAGGPHILKLFEFIK